MQNELRSQLYVYDADRQELRRDPAMRYWIPQLDTRLLDVEWDRQVLDTKGYPPQVARKLQEFQEQAHAIGAVKESLGEVVMKLPLPHVEVLLKTYGVDHRHVKRLVAQEEASESQRSLFRAVGAVEADRVYNGVALLVPWPGPLRRDAFRRLELRRVEQVVGTDLPPFGPTLMGL